ncbi:hypothetical protein MKY75_05530 [Paenibacillus sp. FSL L8-0663]|uniref:hypothetical protein n=1 Tax=Paenibacillus sp. FSL L8-0663 TaxID=2921606 RepID=UPI0030FC5851
MDNNYTLYYPTIEFRDPRWLWSACLMWDRIYRIVPKEYRPQDSRNIQEIIYNSDIICDIDPLSYSLEASAKFIENLKLNGNWWAAALDESNYMKKDYVELHKDKADVKLRQLIIADNADFNSKKWLDVPHDIASIYMLYLADHIAKKNNLSLSTDYAEAWCGSNFFQYDGNLNDFESEEMLTSLVAVTVSGFTGGNIMNLTPVELIKFRENSSQERKRFFQSIREVSTSISACNDPKVISDILNDHLKELRESKKEYIKSMRDIKISAVLGLKTVMVPALVTIISAFSQLPKSLLSELQALGVGVGVIGGFWEAQKNISKERKNFECNYLMQLDKRTSLSWHPYDMNNIHEGYQQYLNDNLNHFLRD